jgi:hypothetical protein
MSTFSDDLEPAGEQSFDGVDEGRRVVKAPDPTDCLFGEAALFIDVRTLPPCQAGVDDL